MYDIFLMDRIWITVQEICKKNKMEKLTQLVVTVNGNSHINKETIYNHITKCNSKLVDENIDIVVERLPIEKQTAIIETLKGDVSEL